MSEKAGKSTKVVAGKLQASIRGIKSLPKNRRVVMETKDAN
jgi:hypothetical protein